jgi:UPF0271 protein
VKARSHGEGPPLEVAPLGDHALRVRLPEGAAPAGVLARLRAAPGVVDAVVTDGFAAAYFSRAPPAPDVLRAWLTASFTSHDGAAPAPRTHTITVRYDGADLADVAARAGCSCEEAIRMHTACIYVVRFVGFAPGFAYLGGLDERLVLPRRASPRPRVPAGAVAIGGGYTGVYPFATAGGWHLIGSADPTVAFDPRCGARLAPGDTVRFVRDEGASTERRGTATERQRADE